MFNGMNVKKVISTVVLVASAVSAFTDVFAKDKQAKEFEDLKKAVADLQNKKGES